MARNVKDEGKGRPGTNGFDPERLSKVVDKIDGHYEELATLQGEYMNRCRSVRQSIANVFEEAKAHGFPVKELRKVIKARQLEAKIEKLRDDLESEQQENYDQLRHALGDFGETDLGQAALDKAPGKPKKAGKPSDEEKDLRPNHLKSAEKTKGDDAASIGASNAAKLQSGIKPITSKEPGHPDGPAAA